MRTKGEILTVRIKNLHLKEHIKSSISILPLGDELYKIGATFNWDQKDEIPTESAKSILLTKLKSIVHLPIEVIKHEAGLRPTVKDRRALIGQHPAFKNLYVFNGLGARGLLLAPLLSSQLASYLEENTPLDAEVNITRYKEEYSC
jgi:glycine/D-amino acid oxidase-like deaminating enzyme